MVAVNVEDGARHGSKTFNSLGQRTSRSLDCDAKLRGKHIDRHHAKLLLRAALPVLAEVAPVPAALLMFADGAASVHHAFKIHRLAEEMADTDEAKQVLGDIEARIDEFDPECDFIDGSHRVQRCPMLHCDHLRGCAWLAQY